MLSVCLLWLRLLEWASAGMWFTGGNKCSATRRVPVIQWEFVEKLICPSSENMLYMQFWLISSLTRFWDITDWQLNSSFSKYGWCTQGGIACGMKWLVTMGILLINTANGCHAKDVLVENVVVLLTKSPIYNFHSNALSGRMVYLGAYKRTDKQNGADGRSDEENWFLDSWQVQSRSFDIQR